MWLYNGKEFTDEDIGDNIAFVYIITNLLNNRKYLGKKGFYFLKTRQVKGKKKRFKINSDWLEYYGSNVELQNDVLLYGPDCFRREIIQLCKTKGEASYYEAKWQFNTDCILDEKFYNKWISCKISQNHVKHLLIRNTGLLDA